MDLIGTHRRALLEFGRRVRAVSPDQWDNATPCTEWSVRELVNHLVVEQLWVPPLVGGATMTEVGDRFGGDQLGADPVHRWDDASAAAHVAFAEPGALDGRVHLSYGESTTRHYCTQMICDLVVHAWDLARGVEVDDTLDRELVDFVYEATLPEADSLANSGLFADPVPVPDTASPQTRLLALYGRRG